VLINYRYVGIRGVHYSSLIHINLVPIVKLLSVSAGSQKGYVGNTIVNSPIHAIDGWSVSVRPLDIYVSFLTPHFTFFY